MPDTNRTYSYPTTPDPITGKIKQPHALQQVTTVGPSGTKLDSYLYDNTGNTTSRSHGSGTQTLAWDAEGHLTKLTEGLKTHEFLYDADGNRLIRRDPDGTTLYLPDQELRHDKTTGTVKGTRYISPRRRHRRSTHRRRGAVAGR